MSRLVRVCLLYDAVDPRVLWERQQLSGKQAESRFGPKAKWTFGQRRGSTAMGLR